MLAVHQLPRGRGLDLILHTPGGSIAATQSIVDYLHKMFGTDIRAIIPQIAMSAGSMIACSSEEIIMGTHSNLGPIDPQIQGRPAYGILDEFKKALAEIKADPAAVHVWRPILSQYEPMLLTECENAIKWSNDFVTRQLKTVMFRKEPKAKAAAKAAKIKPLASHRLRRVPKNGFARPFNRKAIRRRISRPNTDGAPLLYAYPNEYTHLQTNREPYRRNLCKNATDHRTGSTIPATSTARNSIDRPVGNTALVPTRPIPRRKHALQSTWRSCRSC
jgi:hypothetical protein